MPRVSFADRFQNYVPFEDCKEAHPYSLTINPDEDKIRGLIKWNTVDGYIDSVVCHTIAVLQRLKGCITELYLELSPMGKAHFHGVLLVSDVVKFYVHDINKVFKHLGSFKIGTIDKPVEELEKYSSWYEYCTKQQAQWGKERLTHFYSPKAPVLRK